MENEKELSRLLEKVINFPSVSGNEKSLALFLKSYLRNNNEKIRIFTDGKGNLIVQKGKKPEKLALVAHMDKKGFMISAIHKNYLSVVGIRKYTTFPKGEISEVEVFGRFGKVRGILKNSTVNKNNLKVYIKNSLKCDIGDFVSFLPNLKIKDRLASGVGLDNAMGVTVDAHVFNEIEEGTVVFSTQEEIGFKGVGVAIQYVKPKKIIVLDTTYDNPRLSGARLKVGLGPSICFKDSVFGSRQMIDNLINIAEKQKIPHQKEIWEEGNSDLIAIERLNLNIEYCFVGLPIKSNRPPNEVGSLKDMLNAKKLLTEYFQSL